MVSPTENRRTRRNARQREARINRGWTGYLLLGIALVIAGILVIGKATITATRDAEAWSKIGTNHSKPNAPIPPVRGNIYADNQGPLAISVPRYVVRMDFRVPGFSDEIFNAQVDSLSHQLSVLIGDKSAAQYKRAMMQGYSARKQIRLVGREVSYTELMAIRQMPYMKGRGKNSTGLVTEEYIRRVLPYGNLAQRTIGRLMAEPDSLGVTHGNSGLEMKFDSLMCGTHGMNRFVRVPPDWEPVPIYPPIDGMDVYTTLNVDIQDITERALRKALIDANADWGTAVVMEVKTGQIKALSNLDRISEGVYRESTNHALADLIEPGSTFKVMSMMAVLEHNGVNPEDTIDVGNGIYPFARGLTVRDHNAHRGGYGKITYNQVIHFSSNVGVVKAVMKTFGERPKAYLDQLNSMSIFDQIDLEIPGTAKPRFNQDVNSWSRSTMPWSAYGYEILMPPIYTLRFYNAIANDGKMMEPYVVSEVSGNGEVSYSRKPQVINKQIASEKSIKVMKEMLRGVVTDGTGKPMDSPYVTIAGKTGTAQIYGAGGWGGSGHAVTFCGYFPAEEPLYSCIVTVFRPRGVYASGSIPGAVLRDIAEQTVATSHKMTLQDVEADSLAVFGQRVLAGNTKSVRRAIDQTDVSVDRLDKNSIWLKHEGGDSLQILTSTTPQDGVMPDLVGMSVMDAVYLAEKLGLRVTLSGTGGMVARQSRNAGGKISNGQGVILTLRM